MRGCEAFPCGSALQGAQLASTTVAQTGSLPYRGLAIREAFPFSMACRMPFGDTADCQSALHAPTRRRSVVLSSSYRIVEVPSMALGHWASSFIQRRFLRRSAKSEIQQKPT